MATQIVVFVIAIIGAVFSVWILRNNARSVHRERMLDIENEVKSLGGEVVIIEQVDRAGCPYSDQFNEPDIMYKFYRVRYEVENRRKLGYGILIMKQNWYGPGLAADSKWIWRF